MSKRKDIFRIKKNRFGFPIILSRTIMGEKELHIAANLGSFELTVRSNNNKLNSGAAWENVRAYSKPVDEYTLTLTVKEIIKGFREGKVPSWVPALRDDGMFGVLI